MMERTFESVHRELLVAHYQSVKDLKTKTDSWKDRFEKMRYQKVRYQEEYAALKNENSRLRTEIMSLQELKSKTINSGFVQPCRVCESLQKTLDQLREAYKQSTQEKDRLLAILDARLAECTNGDSFLAQFKKGSCTPRQSLLVHNNGDNNRNISVDCKQSPDSTIRITPAKEQPSGNADNTQQNDTENVSKDMKLSLPKRRNLKRHIFTEKTSPQQKRKKVSIDTSMTDHSINKEQACRKRNRNKAPPQVLVPETCDFDMDQSNSREKSLDQMDLSVIKELSVKGNSNNEKIKSKHIGKKDEINEGCIQNSKDKTSNCQKTGKNKLLIYTSDVKVIPETVQMDLFEGVTSSEDEQEDSDSYCHSTVKRAELTQSKYSLRSVLCSPPSSEDEDDTLTDMANAVNHRDIHLSGQSPVNEQEDLGATNDGKSHVRVIDLYDSHSQIGEKSRVSSADQETVVMQSPPSSPFKSFGDESNHRSFNVKPYLRKNLRQDEIHDSDQAGQISHRKSQRKMSLLTSPEQHGSKTSSPLSPALLSPVFNMGNKSKRSQDIVRSPGLFENEGSDVIGQGQQEEPESPLLLRVTSATSEAENITSNIKKQKSSMEVECIEIGSDVDSPVLTMRSKLKRSKIVGSGSLQSSGKSDVTISKLPSVKSLRLSKNSMVELEDPNVSSRQLRQTTLSQVFNNSPVKNKSSPHKQAQEDKDLQKAIQLSLEEATNRDLPDLDETVLEKENTPPFKKPSVPVSKSKIYSAAKSPLKRAKRSKESKLTAGCHGNQNICVINSYLDETLPPEKMISNYKGEDVPQENTKKRKNFRGTADLSLNKSASQGNGSKSPTLQLSQLCEDSEFILDPADIVSSPTGFTDSPQKLQKHCSRSGDGKLNYEKLGLNAKDDLLLDDVEMSDSVVNDFRIDDLHDGHRDFGHKPLMTSTLVDDLDSQSISCSSKSVKFGAGRRKSKVIAVADNSSEVVEEDSEVEEDYCMDDSFDKLPKKEEAGFAHVDVVRKQNERRQLQGYNCKECFDYYKGMELPEAEKKLRMKQCSRHRAKYVPPSTPPHFWSIGFPDTQECEERGYINKEEDLPVQEKRPTFRRRKKLTKIFKSKNEEEKL